MKAYSLQEIANLVGGTIEHAPPAMVFLKGVAGLDNSQPQYLSFLAQASYESQAYTTQAGALLVAKDFLPQQKIPCPLIRVKHVYEALCLFLKVLQQDQRQPKVGTETPAYMGKNCHLGQNIYRGAFSYIGNNVHIGDYAQIYPHVYIGDNAKIGEGSILYAGARIYEGVQIGKDCVIHAGAVLGSDGFGYVHTAEGTHRPIPQIGQLVLEDDVHIGANTTIDRATFDKTLIAKGVRLDNLIQIGHNVYIGEHSIMAAQAGVAGSTKIGSHCVVAGQVGFAGHLYIAPHTCAMAQAGVTKSIEKERSTVVGAPAMPPRSFMSWVQAPKRLEALEKRLSMLEDTTEPSAK